MRLKIILAYDGTAYSGWQIQEKPQPPPTIQGAVETALFSLCRRKIRVFAAGRTDAGVHAHGQVAHFDIGDMARFLELDWRHALNALLPRDIRVISCQRVRPDFHARKDALLKTYVYQFWLEPAFMPPQIRNFAWACGELDVGRMREGAALLLGRHDFASFRNAGTKTETSVREITDITLSQHEGPDYYPCNLPMLTLSISANGFLKQMVRNIAGFLADVGAGKLESRDCAAILAQRDRRALPSATAPARGLALARVQYS